MPRPIRRPKKATRAVAVESSSQPTLETRQDSIQDELFEKGLQTPTQREIAVHAPRTPLSDDEFGFFEVRDVVPVMHRSVRQAPAAIVVRADTDEESELSTLSTISTPSSTPEPTIQRTSKLRQPLKTLELINMLPRAHNSKKKRKSLEIEESEDDEFDEDRITSKRSKRKNVKSTKTIATKKSSKVVKRKQRDPTPLLTDDDDEDDDGEDNERLGLSADALRKLDKIRAQFEEVDEWNMETETVSSPFYSS